MIKEEKGQKVSVHIRMNEEWADWLNSKYGSTGLGVRAIVAENFYREKRGRNRKDLVNEILSPGKPKKA